MGPEILAKASEKPGFMGKSAAAASKAAKSGMKVKIPPLKELVTTQGALLGLLRSIMGFLRTRFPAVLGLNVLWSLALFSKFLSLHNFLLPPPGGKKSGTARSYTVPGKEFGRYLRKI